MINLDLKSVGKRVVFLINAHAYDAFNYSSDSSTSLVLIADIVKSDDETVTIKNIEVRSTGLFSAEKYEDDEKGGIKINGGQLDKRFIIGMFDDFSEVENED